MIQFRFRCPIKKCMTVIFGSKVLERSYFEFLERLMMVLFVEKETSYFEFAKKCEPVNKSEG